MKFQVFTRIGNEAENCWSDGDGLCDFETYEAAAKEVVAHVSTCKAAVESGYLSDFPKLTEFFIRSPSGEIFEVLPPGLPIASFQKYTRFNSAGGTVLIDTPITATVYRCFFNDEIGWVFHGYPTAAIEQDLIREMNPSELPILLMSQHDLVGDYRDIVMAIANGAGRIETPDGYAFLKSGDMWSDGDLSFPCTLEELVNLGANVDRLMI